MQHYSEEFKKSIIQKSLLPGGPSLRSLANKNGLVATTVYGWRNKYAKESKMKNTTLKWTAEKRLEAIIETSPLSENKQGEYLRKNGLHSSDLEQWKEDFYSSQGKVGRPKSDPEIFKLKKDKKILEKNLKRKDQVLAEMSARVILLKKTQLLFADEEGNE